MLEIWKKEKDLKWTNYQNNKFPTKENVWGLDTWKGA
jgi:hypothetical protein